MGQTRHRDWYFPFEHRGWLSKDYLIPDVLSFLPGLFQTPGATESMSDDVIGQGVGFFFPL